MTDQEILDNAPKGSTHIDGGEYLDATTASYWSLAKSKWCGVDELILQDDIRSLADIKRIVELEDLADNQIGIKYARFLYNLHL